MLLPKGSINYDPQLIKPPAGYTGSDVMDFDAAKKSLEGNKTSTADTTSAAPGEVTVVTDK